jgi:hypothetical protein
MSAATVALQRVDVGVLELVNGLATLSFCCLTLSRQSIWLDSSLAMFRPLFGMAPLPIVGHGGLTKI